MRFAIIDKNNLIVNVVEWDQSSRWSPPADCTLLKVNDDDIAEPRGEYDNGKFIRAPSIDIPMSEVDKLKKILLDKKIITEEDIEVSLRDETLRSSIFVASVLAIIFAIGIIYYI